LHLATPLTRYFAHFYCRTRLWQGRSAQFDGSRDSWPSVAIARWHFMVAGAQSERVAPEPMA
jgi:hypothetical protein